jgi:glycosyltransferase involved in cell wall biosynthesis
MKVEKIFIGIAQRMVIKNLPENVKVIIIWHDIRNIELRQDIRELYYYSEKNIYSSIRIILKILLYPIYKKLQMHKKIKMYKPLINLAIRNNTEIITDSNHSKYSILSVFPELANKNIEVLWPPTIISNEKENSINILKNTKYWLLLSADRYEKNSFKIVKALLKIDKFRNSNIKLVIVGNIKNLNIYKMLSKIKWIVAFNYLDRSSIEWLYKNCSVFLFPSYSEGFGYPPIEAMRYSKPIIASATSSIIEICENAPLYMCPYSDIEIEARIRQILDEDLELYKKKSYHQYEKVKYKQQEDLKKLINIIKNS